MDADREPRIHRKARRVMGIRCAGLAAVALAVVLSGCASIAPVDPDAGTESPAAGGETTPSDSLVPDASIAALLPAGLDNWVTISAEQAFDSDLAPIEGSDTTEQWIDALERGVSTGELDGTFDSVDFKSGAQPSLSKIVFYAPEAEQDADAPSEVAAVFAFDVPEVVGDDQPLLEAFHSAVAANFGVARSEIPVYVSDDGSILRALVQHSYLYATAGSPDFVDAYAEYLRPIGAGTDSQ